VGVRSAIAAGLCLIALLLPASSQATSPGGNGKIAFASNEELFTIDPDGTDLTRIPTTSCEGLEPDWAPDSRAIGFIERCGPSGTFDLSVVNVDGTALRRIYATNRDDARIDWSPDGSQALFISDASGNREIYKSDAGFTQVVNLTNSPRDDDFPAWSPDGTKVAFTSNRTGDYEVYSMKADGTGVVNLTNNGGQDGGGDRRAGGPSWSPDGAKIVFDSTRTGPFEIFSMDSAGGNVTQLTNGGWNVEPAWSPDGRLSAFTSDRTGVRQLFLMSSDGTNESQLTTHLAFNERPDWQVLPDRCKRHRKPKRNRPKKCASRS
jgi:Tol biopolymer transport system component